MSDNPKPESGTLPPLDLSGGSKYVPPEAGIGERIKVKRKELGLTVEKLAELTALYDPENNYQKSGGISVAAIYKYEKGDREPGARELRLLSEALFVSPSWLLLGEEWSSMEEDSKLANALRSLFADMNETLIDSKNEWRRTEHTLKLQQVKQPQK